MNWNVPIDDPSVGPSLSWNCPVVDSEGGRWGTQGEKGCGER